MKTLRYFARLKGSSEPVTVDLEPLGNSRFALTLHQRRREVDVLALEGGTLSLLIEGRSFSVEIEERGEELLVETGSRLSSWDVADERRARLRPSAASFESQGKQVILAPMPGKIVKLLVKLGDEVTQGQGLVVVEAMKMENELKSPKAGKVTEVHAQEGSAVEINAKLLVVE